MAPNHAVVARHGASVRAVEGREGIVVKDPHVVLVSSIPTPLAAMGTSESETYLGLLIITAFWAFLSGLVVAVIEHEGEASQREAVGWTASFAAASLVAAFCFSMLL